MGSDVFHAEILNARKTIEDDKTGQITDMIDDERLAEAERFELQNVTGRDRKQLVEDLI